MKPEPEILRVFLLVNDALRASGIPHVLIGELASNLWVSAEEVHPTDDVDFAVAGLVPDPVGEVVTRLQRRGIRDFGPFSIEDILPDETPKMRFRKLTACGVKVDFVFPRDATFAKSILRRSRNAMIRRRTVRVASPEDIFLLKSIAGRLKDLAAMAALARRPGFDRAYVRRWARSLGTLRLTRRFLE